MYVLTDDVRIASLRPLISPAILIEEIPASDAASELVATARREIGEIIAGNDKRLLVVCGPCSIHDPAAALEYAGRLKEVADQLRTHLLIVMRTYFEKPRTTVGWKGLINDPDLNDTFAINKGLRIARGFLRDVIELGMPTGTEFLDPISPQFFADLVCWGAIGARTTESQVHRELASGLSMPVGFKNGTGGSIQIAVDAVRAAGHPHRFLSVTKQGIAAIVTTKGNPHCHVILRGGRERPNYGPDDIRDAASRLAKANLTTRVMVDCSHANSDRSYERQAEVAANLGQQIVNGGTSICGVMLESFLEPGRQDATPGRSLAYGQSITDACIGWNMTVPVLEELAEAVARATAGR